MSPRRTRLCLITVISLILVTTPALSQTSGTTNGAKPAFPVDGLRLAPSPLPAMLTAPGPLQFGEPPRPTHHQGPSVLDTNGIGMSGTAHASWSGSFARLAIDEVHNNSSVSTGPLRLDFWWSAGGFRQSGYSTAVYPLGSLNPFSYFMNVDSGLTLTFTPPPTGCYHTSLLLERYQSDGTWAYDDYIDFTSNDPVSVNGGCTACVTTTTSACLLNRFQATLNYRGVFDNNPPDQVAWVKPVTGFASTNYETCFFYFNSSNNIEVLLKMLDQGNTDSQGFPTIAVLFGTATPLRVQLLIRDTLTGLSKTYGSAFGAMQGQTDFSAFRK